MASNKIRITKEGGKGEFSKFPAEVREAIRAASKGGEIKSFGFDTKPQGYRVYAGEGTTITMVYGQNTQTVETVAEYNLGAGGMNHAIGAEVAPPVGTTIITVSYYGGFFMNVTNIIEPAIAGPVS